MRYPNLMPTSRRQVLAIAAGVIVGGAADASRAVSDFATDPLARTPRLMEARRLSLRRFH